MSDRTKGQVRTLKHLSHIMGGPEPHLTHITPGSTSAMATSAGRPSAADSKEPLLLTEAVTSDYIERLVYLSKEPTYDTTELHPWGYHCAGQC